MIENTGTAGETSSAGYWDYWGKARPGEDGPRFHRLAYHSLDVAAVGAVLLQRDGALTRRLSVASGLSDECLSRFVTFGLAVHDVGKFGPAFQDLKPEVVTQLQGPRARTLYKTRHDAMGLSAWCDLVASVAIEEGWIAFEGDLVSTDERTRELLVEPWLRSVVGHHGAPVTDSAAVLMQAFPPKSRARSDVLSFVNASATLFGPIRLAFTRSPGASLLEDALKPSSWMVAGLAVLCDWIGSNVAWFPYREDIIPLADYWDLARDRARHALEESGVLPRLPAKAATTRSLFPAVLSPRPMQRAVEDVELGDGPRVFILEDLTGSGKTEAAVVLAQRLVARGEGAGIFFALPTLATANAMYERIQEVVPRLFAAGENPSVVLAHSAPHLAGLRNLDLPPHPCEGEYADGDLSVSAQCSAWIADSRKRALLAQVGVGTIDQALMAVLQARHSTLRLLGVNRNVLVVDEVHAYDAYMTEHLCRLLEFQAGLGGSAILLSATIPTAQRRRLTAAFQRGLGVTNRTHVPDAAYPLLTRVDASGVQEVAVVPAPGSARSIFVRVLDSVEAAENFVVDAARQRKRVCWIRNTVPDAMEAHARLATRVPPEQLGLFHARFAMGDRLRIEAQVLRTFGKNASPEDSHGRILVATQVVEQSLDLDFDELVTDLAPMDLIIQRAGRLHRHARPSRPPPVLHVLAPAPDEDPKGTWYSHLFPRAAHVYPDFGQLWLTLRALLRQRSLELPSQARALMDAVFSESARAEVPAGLEKASQEAETRQSVQRSVAKGGGVDLLAGYGGDGRAWETDARVATRLGEPTSLVRLARCEGETVEPWFAHGTFGWELSQLQVPKRRIAQSAPSEADVVARAQSTMPFVDEGTVTVVLRDGPEGWSGRAVDAEGRAVRARYDEQTGLRVEKEG